MAVLQMGKCLTMADFYFETFFMKQFFSIHLQKFGGGDRTKNLDFHRGNMRLQGTIFFDKFYSNNSVTILFEKFKLFYETKFFNTFFVCC